MQVRLATVPLLVVMIGATGLLMLIPSFKAFADGQAHVGRAFLYSGVVSFLLAVFLSLALSSQPKKNRRSDGLFPLLTAIYLLIPRSLLRAN